MKIRYPLIALSMLLGSITAAEAQISVNIGLPGINIGIDMPVYPNLVLIPGYPVYYDPNVNSNYFFYDGMYWVFQNDNWYASSWYNGPWQLVQPEYIPLFVLRIPVRYYRQPPMYFRGWRNDEPPRWGEHWGRDWEQHRGGWQQWDRRSIPAAAPLPIYQRQYSGNRYPRAAEQQRAIRSEQYHYQPRDAVTRQNLQPRDNQDNARARQQQQELQQQRQQHDNSNNARDRQQQELQQQRQEQQQQQRQRQEQQQQHDNSNNARARQQQELQQQQQRQELQQQQQRQRQEQQAPLQQRPPQHFQQDQPQPMQQPPRMQRPQQAPQDNVVRERRIEPQNNPREHNAEQQGRIRDNNAGGQDNNRGNRTEERDQNRR